MANGRPPTRSTEEILAAIDRLLEAGERDLWEGGVRAHHLADELDCPLHTAKNRLYRLADDDHLTQVWGADPETYEPRQSYLPADHPDAQPPEY